VKIRLIDVRSSEILASTRIVVEKKQLIDDVLGPIKG